MLNNQKNSWVLSVKNREATKYNHHYYCTCSKEFKLQTDINEKEAPDILCPICANDYFKDAVVFANMNGTKIWKYFKWLSILNEDKNYWTVMLQYDLPVYNNETESVSLQKQDLLHIKLKKDGTDSFKISYKSKTVSQYSLYSDDRVQALKTLLIDDAKEYLYKYIMASKSADIAWIDSDNMNELSLNEKLKYLTFFLKNSHLKEHRFYFWRMDNIDNHTIKYTTQDQMLDFIVDHRKEKSVKKALYIGYEESINHIGYYPYSDYIFSRTIENIDLLVKLYKIHPIIKQNIFTAESFLVGMEFILFLKQYYTEKQIIKLFVVDMQDVKEYNKRLNNWRDTLRMLQVENANESLKEHFNKVKLTTKTLHDEVVRVFHLVSYILDSKEFFEYDDIHLSACGSYERLVFKLPSTVAELCLWAKILHNCMFGYSRSIHQQKSIIYGVFKDGELLYAVELKNYKIVQAKAVSNFNVPSADMMIINNWKNNNILIMNT